MAIDIRAVRLQAPATNTTQDFTISGFGTPDACIMLYAEFATDGTDSDDTVKGVGFTDGTDERSMFNYSDHNTAAASVEHICYEDNVAIVNTCNSSGTPLRTATSAFITDGIRLTWAGTTSDRPLCTAILITGINGAASGSITPNATVDATASATSLGITPKVVFFVSTNQPDGGDFGTDAAWSMGFAYDNGSTYDQATVSQHVNRNTNDCVLWAQNNRCGLGWTSAGGQDYDIELTDMASGSFEITTRTDGRGTTMDHFYLALDITEDAEIFETTVPTTDVAWTPMTGASFTPQAVFMLTSHTTTVNTDITDANAGSMGFYYADDDGDEFGYSFCVDDGAATSDCSNRNDTQLMIQDDTAGTPDFTATNPSFSSGQIQFASGDAGEATAAYKVFGIAFETGSGGGSGNPWNYYAQQ